MLGLPSEIDACLFDLDGVLTQTATVHAAAWKEMFDDFLRARAERTGEPFVPFDECDDYDEYVDGKPRYDGVRSFLAVARDRAARGRPGRPVRRGDGRRPRQPQERARPRADSQRRASRRTRARCATSMRCATPGCTAAVVSSSANCREVLVAAGIEDLFEVRDRRRRCCARAPEGQAGAGHFPCRGTRGSACSRREAAVFEDALAGVEAGRAGRFGFVVGVDRTGQARGAARARRRHRRRRPRRAARPAHDHPPGVRRRAVVSARDASSTSRCSRRPSRCSRSPTGTSGCARTSTRASRSACPGTYLNSFYELRPLPYAEAGYGYPESGQTIVNVTNGKIIRLLVDDEPFDVRYGRAAGARARARPPRRRPAPRRAEWGSPAGAAVRVRSTRLVSFAQRVGCGDPVRGRAARRPVRVVVQSELVANEPAPPAAADPRAAAVLESPLVSEELLRPRRAGRAGALDAAQQARAWRRAWTTSSRGRTAPTSAARARRTSAASRSPPTSRGRALRVVKFLAYGWSSQRSLPALRDAGRRRARRGPAHRLGRPARGAARVPRRVLGIAPTSSSTATPSCSRPFGSRSSTRCRPAPAPSSARSPPRG